VVVSSKVVGLAPGVKPVRVDWNTHQMASFEAQQILSSTGLPDDMYHTKHPNLGIFWRAVENVDIFNGHS
jgi:hypothetical protein